MEDHVEKGLQLGLDTERIIVPFSSKGVNHMAYLANFATVVWWKLKFDTIIPYFHSTGTLPENQI